ncbi:hypothetical protein TNCV_2294251 [Trichonephila clavipes]|nr:hypothetical protein TNCV_2294251 [Trichonephila clavipes]
MTCVPSIFASRKSFDSSRGRTRNLVLTMWARYLYTVERCLSESIGAGYRSDYRKPNAIHAVYETGHYTNIGKHHMQETW